MSDAIDHQHPFLIGGGTTGAEIRAFDWPSSQLGPIDSWPEALKVALATMLASPQPMFMAWGPELIVFFNDSYRPILGQKLAGAVGLPFAQLWADVWEEIEPIVQRALAGEGSSFKNMPLTMRRNGYPEQTWWSFTYMPLRDGSGTIQGMLCTTNETTAEVQAAAALRQSEQRQRDLLQQMPGFIGVTTGPDHVYEYVNDAFVAISGPRQFIGRSMRDVFPELERQGYFELIDHVYATGEPYAARNIPFRLAGEVRDRFTDLTYQPIRNDAGAITGIFVGGYEVTEQNRASQALRDLNADLERKVIERALARGRTWQVSPDLLVVINHQGTFEVFNPAWTATLGWSEQELTGLAFADLVHPDDQAATQAVWLDAVERGLPALRFENRYRHKDGSYRWLSWVGVPDDGKVYCSARDITAERQQAAELRLHRDIVQSDTSPILAFDHDCRVLAFNRAHDEDFQRVMGRRQAIGDVLPELFPAEQATALKGLMDRALAGERFVIIGDFGDPGRVMPSWEITYTPLYDADGQVIGAFHHARDISERKLAEANLASTEDALRQSQKMEAVGQLTGGVAHDFNNLLTVIKSSTDLLKRPNLAEERRTRYIAAISDTVDRAAKLTGQLLAFARRQALKPEVFAAGTSVRNLADMMRTLTGSRVQITTELPDVPCYVNADGSQFDTALVNLAVNARDAMNGEGKITITVSAVDAVPATRAHPTVPGAYVAVSLSDTGTGISAEMIERIFEPFFTTKGIGKGTGLGLSQVFGFAKQSGGDITVASTLGEGTTFTIYLPRVAAPRQAKAVEELEALADGQGTCVLVVEDNIDVGTFAVQTLNDLGYSTILAADGTAALAELAKNADLFDVVFSDVMMPGMSGIELGEEVRRLYPDLPVVLTSGYSHILAQNGTHGFELLHKPYSVEQLSQVLRKAAAGQRRKRPLSK
ncbi:PAS domain-containing protein [Methylorubrum sp. SB2]|uniref:PAS domain-containing protein n=1 Tax=Methylorubrum subtropicum TaxID=3138812 RepID=UPI00313B3965